MIPERHNPKIIEIPTVPSASAELLQTLQKLPIKQMAANLNNLLIETNKLITLVNKDSPNVMKDVSVLTHSLSQVARKIEKTLNSFDEDSRTMLDLNKMLRDFSAAAQSLQCCGISVPLLSLCVIGRIIWNVIPKLC